MQAWGRQRWVRRLVTLAVVALSAAVIGWMLWTSWPSLAATRGQWRAWPIAVAALLYVLDLLLAVWGWSRLLNMLAPRLSFRQHLRVYGLTLVAARIPGAPWHLVGRTVLYAQHGLSRRVTGVAAGMEVVLIAVAGFITGQLVGRTVPDRVWLPVAAIVVVAGLVLLHPSIVKRIVVRVSREQPPAELRYRDILSLLANYVLVWVVGGLMLYCVILAFHPLPLSDLPAIVGAWGLSGSLSMLAFFSPSGLGVREITLTALLVLFVPLGVAVVVAIAMRLLLTSLELIAVLAAARL
jgi:hypothetical protein